MSDKSQPPHVDVRKLMLPAGVFAAILMFLVSALFGLQSIRESDLKAIDAKIETRASAGDTRRLEGNMKSLEQALQALRTELQATREVLVEVRTRTGMR